MSLLGGFSYGGEKTAVIFDIGHAFTKCGFAGENGPRAIIPTEIKHSKTGNVTAVFESCQNEEELHSLFIDFFYQVYFRHLLVNPKERRVVVVESVLMPSSLRNTIAKVLFKRYEVPSVVFAPSHLVAILTLGVQTALVVDAGYKETIVLPVYEGTPLLKAWQALPLAGKAIHNYLEAELKESATISSHEGDKPLSSVLDKIDEKILETIKVKCCFVTKMERAKLIQAVNQGKAEQSQSPEAPPGVDYPLDGGKILHISGKIRENTCEILFEQDNEETSVATLLLDSILQCPVDTRQQLSQNIVIMGGTAMLPGFHHRLLEELRHLVKKEKYENYMKTWNFKFHQPPSKPNYTAWLGGAILGGLEILSSRSVSRDAYSKNEQIPDWCCLYEPEEKEEKLATPLKR